jgi:hypothetical protein
MTAWSMVETALEAGAVILFIAAIWVWAGFFAGIVS